MKLGIIGGSFNPVHLGHLFLADIAISALKLDRVVFIPAYRSPFKLDALGIECSAADRLDMLAEAVDSDCRLTIDGCELNREGVSYTVDTLEDIIARYMPAGKPALIIGDDLAPDFPKWRDSQKILELADVVIGRRVNAAASKTNYPFPHILLENEVMNISSHKVRQGIAAGGVWRSLVPAGARAIIEDRKLYGFSDSYGISSRTIRQIEAAVRESLSIRRFIHSRNTAVLAYDLCRRFALDPAEGYLAGIAHDFGKELDSKQMIKLAKSDGKPITRLEKDKPNLLHGRAGAVLLKDRFSIHNKNILEAVAVHTSGSENMEPLAKVVYIADKAEVSRNIDGQLRKMCLNDDGSALDDMLFAVLKKTVSKLQAKKLDLSEDTLRLLDRMNKRNK